MKMIGLRGRLLCLVLFSLFFSSVAQGVIFHEDFDEADEDLYSIVSFLSDTKSLCEESLWYSYLCNCSVLFEGNVVFSYDQGYLNLSFDKTLSLEEHISYSYDVLDELRGVAGSYFYLKDYLIPLRDLGNNVTDFVGSHFSVVENFSKIVDFLSYGFNESDVFLNIANASKGVLNCKRIISRIRGNIAFFDENFSTVIIRSYLGYLDDLMIRYDSYLDTFVSLIRYDEPTLFLFVDRKSFFLDEKIFCYGFFIADNSFIFNQKIDVFFDDKKCNTSFSDLSGRFNSSVSLGQAFNPGVYNLSCTTFYNGSVVSSKVLSVNVSLLPTSLVLSVSEHEFFLNESIVFSGRLYDYRNRFLNKNLSLVLPAGSVILFSDRLGLFSYEFENSLSFGKYTAYAFFESDGFYKSSKSDIVRFNVSTPTSLSINLDSDKKIGIDDKLRVSGVLGSRIDDRVLVNQTIRILLDDEKLGLTRTDDNGFYSFTSKADIYRSGSHSIRAVFVSDNLTWRSSRSELVLFNVEEDLGLGNLFYIAVIFFVIGFFTVFLFFRKKLLGFIFTVEDSNQVLAEYTPSFDRQAFYRQIIDEKDFLVDVDKTSDAELGDLLISSYQSLIGFLRDNGMSLKTGVTHLDVRKKMINEGFSRSATNVVTKAFEYAMYSPYPIEKKHVSLFNTNISIILSEGGV